MFTIDLIMKIGFICEQFLRQDGVGLISMPSRVCRSKSWSIFVLFKLITTRDKDSSI